MRRFSTLLILCAWLIANGAHWDLVQGFAWARMITDYSRTMSLAEAVKKTFTANNLCGVCEFVADNHTQLEADRSGTDTSVPRDSFSSGKAALFVATPPEHVFVFCAVTSPEWPKTHLRPHGILRAAPPIKPPRVA